MSLLNFHLTADIPIFFESVEKLFDSVKVPVELRTRLLLPHLSEHARSLLLRLDHKRQDDDDNNNNNNNYNNNNNNNNRIQSNTTACSPSLVSQTVNSVDHHTATEPLMQHSGIRHPIQDKPIFKEYLKVLDQLCPTC